jgi:hypothetical protein
MTSGQPTGADGGVGMKTNPAQNYRVHGVSRPGGHGKIRCNTTDMVCLNACCGRKGISLPIFGL